LGRNGTDHESIDRCILAYVDWYNNGKKISPLQNAILKKDILDKEMVWLVCTICKSSKA
jgi:hypothetical protein